MLQISQIRLRLDEGLDAALEKALSQTGLKASQVKEMEVTKVSVDARRGKVELVCEVTMRAGEQEERVAKRGEQRNIRILEEKGYQIPWKGQKKGDSPIVVGLGPAGLFAGLVLARAGLCPTLIERGGPVEERAKAVEQFWQKGILDPENNVQFGEGGAGTFSDGKLTTRIRDMRCRFIMEELIAHGAPEAIRWQAKPHVGTDLLRNVVHAIRSEVIALGGQVIFHCRIERLKAKGKKICGVVAKGDQFFPASQVVLAPGHSARDTFFHLEELGLPLEGKAFSVGARIEHPQKGLDQGLYGSFAGHPLLGPAEYQLSHRDGQGRGVYTFCMCPGGVVVPAASEMGRVVVNGMSEHARDLKNANSALVVSVTPQDFGKNPLDGVHFQRKLEEKAFLAGGKTYRAPAQSVGCFFAGKAGLTHCLVEPSYALGVTPYDLHDLLPDNVTRRMEEGLRQFGKKIPGFDQEGALLTGVETRTSSPVRILRGDDFQSPGMEGLYPCGEGAGYAGGIMSAAVDGMKVAEAILLNIVKE